MMLSIAMRRLTLLLGIAFALMACGRSAPPDVLLITVDTLRYDYCTVQHMPATTAFFSHDFIFSRAYAPVPTTLASHTCLMTGLPYAGLFVDGRLAKVNTLAEVLRCAGYRTSAFISGFPLDHQFGLDQGFDLYEDHFLAGQDTMFRNAQSWAGHPYERFDRRGDFTVDLFLSYWKRPASGPRFVWLHLYDPHAPYAPDRYAFDYNPFHPRNPGELDRIRKAYGEECAFVDHQLARVWQAVDRRHTLVVCTSDHGENLCDHDDYLTHNEVVYETTLHVPLMIHVPGRGGRIVPDPVINLDDFPTILTLLGRPSTPTLGRDLSPLMLKAQTIVVRALHAECRGERWGAGAAVFDGPWKYIAQPGLRNMLFRLDRDPREKQDLLARYPAVAARLHKDIERWWKGGRLVDPLSPLLTDPERIRAFKALGYIQ